MSRRVTIVGAGAIGGTVGAYLARAGHDVLMVDAAADHVAAMQRDGLEIQAFDETFRTPLEAATPDGLEGPLELVLLAVKAQHTEDAVARLARLLAVDGTVVSLQNGLCERALMGMRVVDWPGASQPEVFQAVRAAILTRLWARTP